MKRILVTGSRDWPDTQEGWDIIYRALREAVEDEDLRDVVLVHGAARGADQTARKAAHFIGFGDEAHRPDWQYSGKRAGLLRNEHMVSLGADICLAFIKDNSRGASHCASLAEEAGIETRRFTA